MNYRPAVSSLVLSVIIAASLPAQDGTIVRGAEGVRADSLLREAESRGFNGVALIARDGQTLLYKGYGYAIRAPNTPFRPSTVVQIGSNVKDFNRVIIQQLAAEGRLTLDDTLGRFFPQAPADKRGITIRQLLNHRAGFPQHIGPDSEVIDQAPYLARAFAAPLAFRPGTGEQYSNTGYSILAAIIQQLTGQSFDAVVKTRIFDAAGMTETGLLLPHFDPSRLAHGYDGGRDRGTMLDMPHAADGHYWNLRGNGGMVSTLSDMLRFYRSVGASLLPADEPDVLAGSDLTSYFMFGNWPRMHTQVVLASNVAESPAPRVMRELVRALALEPDRQGPSGTTIAALPTTGPGSTVAAYFAAFNSGDTVAMQRFFTEHATTGPGAPPMEVRIGRYKTMFADLGRLTPSEIRQRDDGFDVVVRSAQGEEATFSFQVANVAPFQMLGLRVER